MTDVHGNQIDVILGLLQLIHVRTETENHQAYKIWEGSVECPFWGDRVTFELDAPDEPSASQLATLREIVAWNTDMRPSIVNAISKFYDRLKTKGDYDPNYTVIPDIITPSQLEQALGPPVIAKFYDEYPPNFLMFFDCAWDTIPIEMEFENWSWIYCGHLR